MITFKQGKKVETVSEPEAQGWNKVYRDLERLVGKQGTLAIYHEFRGLQINFPVRLISRAHMMEVLRYEYDGDNKQKLANHYGYSQRSIERMLKELEDEALEEGVGEAMGAVGEAVEGAIEKGRHRVSRSYLVRYEDGD